MSNPIEQLVSEDGTIDARSLNGGGRDSSPIEPITRRDCYRLRMALLRGAELREHTAAAHYQRSGAHYHAKGKCRHDHSIPPVTHTTSGHGDSKNGEWVIEE